MVEITVDGKIFKVKKDALLIEELLAHKINIPHFCYHQSLGKDGNCRMCMVEIEGKKRPQIACDTPIKEGMVVRTRGENIDKVKRSILELELINHPVDCPICDQAGECKLQDYYMETGLYDSRLDTVKTHGKKHIDLGCNVMLDQERCVLCTRCVRFTKNITKTSELVVIGRADHSVIGTFEDRKLDNPYAMNVVDLCPVGALTSKDFRFHQRVWFLKTQEAICDGCAKGCAIYVDHHREKYKDDTIYRYRPRFNPDVNGYFMCDFGRLGYKKENNSICQSAYIRGKTSEYEYAEGKFARLLKRHTGKIVFMVSQMLSLEELFRLKKLAKNCGAKISGYGEVLWDESFGDDFLKSSDRALNRKAFDILSIDVSQEFLSVSLLDAELVVFIRRQDVHTSEALGYKGASVFLDAYCYNSIFEGIDLILPIASHTSRDGSFVNVDGYVQYSSCVIKKNFYAKPLLTLIAQILKDSIFTCRDVWEDGLSQESMLCDIDFDTLSKTSQKIKL
ncbi:MAG: 2Fe-2S iron-sulfur cluster-binding protein [Sulfurospirillaceae bacterium]|nr:2Fe-2S iron-sulfur cluster-binding protein [Sulfurospirillaceae bacterium]